MLKGYMSFISKCQFNSNDVLGAACLGYSETVFNGIRKEDVISWNAMIGAYAQHGESLKALHNL
jgi:hypothetical protein